MPLQSTDLHPVRRGTTTYQATSQILKDFFAAAATTAAAGTVQLADAAAITAGTAGRVVDAAQLKTAVAAGTYTLPAATATVIGGVKPGANLTVAADGTLNASISGALIYKGTADPTAAPPAGPVGGSTYLASATGTAAAGWTGIAGTSIRAGDLLLYNGTAWTTNAAGLGVTSVRGSGAISVDSTNAASPLVTVAAATTTATGTVQLADAAAITAGTAGRVVDAAQLKAAAFLPLDFSTLPALP